MHSKEGKRRETFWGQVGSFATSFVGILVVNWVESCGILSELKL